MLSSSSSFSFVAFLCVSSLFFLPHLVRPVRPPPLLLAAGSAALGVVWPLLVTVALRRICQYSASASSSLSRVSLSGQSFSDRFRPFPSLSSLSPSPSLFRPPSFVWPPLQLLPAVVSDVVPFGCSSAISVVVRPSLSVTGRPSIRSYSIRLWPPLAHFNRLCLSSDPSPLSRSSSLLFGSSGHVVSTIQFSHVFPVCPCGFVRGPWSLVSSCSVLSSSAHSLATSIFVSCRHFGPTPADCLCAFPPFVRLRPLASALSPFFVFLSSC